MIRYLPRILCNTYFPPKNKITKNNTDASPGIRTSVAALLSVTSETLLKSVKTPK